MEWNDKFMTMFRAAVARFHAQPQTPSDHFFLPEEGKFLSEIGYKESEMYAYIKAYATKGDPSPSTVLLIAAMRRSFFITSQRGIFGNAQPVTEEDLLIESAKMPGFEAQEDKGITVILDTTLTPELIEAGFVRELISRIQTMRKEADFEVTDRILVTVKTADEKLAAIVEANVEAIKNGVLALEVVLADAVDGAYTKDWSINGVDATLSVRKA